MENSRLVPMEFSAGGWLDGLMSVWQPVHPITLWTDCAKASPGICNESDFAACELLLEPRSPMAAQTFRVALGWGSSGCRRNHPGKSQHDGCHSRADRAYREWSKSHPAA